MLIQIFIPCYFGQQLTNVSDELSLTLFHSNFYEADRKVQSSIKIIIEHAKQPKKFRCAYIFDITLELLVSILNFAYSLYAVMNNVSN